MVEKMPRVESEFLEDVLESFRRRSKALKHRNAKPKIERFLDVYEDGTEERIEIRITPRPNQTLRLVLWSDRYIDVWVGEIVRQKGWKFQYQKTGRFVGGIDCKKIVVAVEETLSVMAMTSGEYVKGIELIWKPLLATGPTVVRSGIAQ